MKECVIVGRPNSGKTLFALNFASYLGSKTIDVIFRTHDGLITCRHFTLTEARRELCAPTPHKTRSVQSVILKTNIGKAIANFKMTDTCGIAEQIHSEENIRRGMAQTLSLLRCADMIIHIIDITTIADHLNKLSAIDHEIYNYGIIRRNYILLANKTDLQTTDDSIVKLTSLFPQANIIPISAANGRGFKEVKACVARNI